MGKHAKSKSNGRPAGPGASSRPAPYTKGKQPRVEVKSEGPSSGSSAPATSAATSNSSKARSNIQVKAANVKSSAATAAAAATSTPSTKEKGKSKAVTESTSVQSSTTMPISTGTFVIIAGSYEKLLYGLEGSYPSTSTAGARGKASNNNPTLEPIFIFPAHLACVKAVAASPGGKWLATGSEDEFVKVWDLRRRKEVGSLSQHTGSITSLHFPTQSHLITTSVDSTLSLFRTSDWALLKTLKGHSGRVNHVDVHPTGRVALSVGKDMTLKMWDLMRGRGAASLPLGTEAEMVKFSQTGTHFAVLFPRKVQIYSLTLKLLHTLTTKSRFNTLAFASLLRSGEGDENNEEEDEEEEELLCVGTEKGVVEVYNITVGTDEESEDEDEDEGEGGESVQNGKGADVEKVATLIGHTNRIKSVSVLPFAAPAIDGQDGLRKTTLLTTVSSDGLINLYDLSAISGLKIPTSETQEQEQKIEPVASYDTKGSRLTCVYIADGQDVARIVAGQNKKSQAAQNVDDEEEDDDDEEEDMYESGEGDEDEDDDEEMVEFEDEEEEEEEDEEEGEYED
ncbi:protein MAK11 [Kwoniella heveanensis CBS 569]|nr:protein MAK11 [Kwoniella heveanensis CBS 569]